MALLFALSFTGAGKAEIASPDRALDAAATNNNLLITPRNSSFPKRQITVPREPGQTFEVSMDRAGWNVEVPATLYFFNARKIIAQQQLMSVEDEINRKFYENNRRRAVDSSA